MTKMAFVITLGPMQPSGTELHQDAQGCPGASSPANVHFTASGICAPFLEHFHGGSVFRGGRGGSELVTRVSPNEPRSLRHNGLPLTAPWAKAMPSAAQRTHDSPGAAEAADACFGTQLARWCTLDTRRAYTTTTTSVITLVHSSEACAWTTPSTTPHHRDSLADPSVNRAANPVEPDPHFLQEPGAVSGPWTCHFDHTRSAPVVNLKRLANVTELRSWQCTAKDQVVSSIIRSLWDTGFMMMSAFDTTVLLPLFGAFIYLFILLATPRLR